ncbi:hypothetical protein BST96_10960 [Oceanicoccus sagamiensis]|uniref:Light-independent protochlorophyllide reductase subunit B-like C-terminal domain-containing protein n=2 Tax=Oceanicoccus sagamiensis TaxID=716816 RepID=A0A1X9NFE5_9GAMM|nr:hypothetical protein BST96_10960 [Oceanicoccus sagamiensis]
MNIQGICDVLDGKVRGKPVAITKFVDEIPDSYDGIKVDPCQILRHAMDDGKRVYFDRQNQDCIHGAYITGVHEGNEQIQSGRLLTDYIPAYNIDAAYTFNSGEYILPQGTVKGFGAAPLDNVPEGSEVDWIVVVCTPGVAGMVSAARAVKDGTRPDTAAGNSYCSDMFVSPFYNDNVIITPGDVGGRNNNKLKESELFVIIPAKWADGIIDILGATPDVKGIFEATRPEDSPYWDKQKAKKERAANRTDKVSKVAKEKYGLEISMEWDIAAVETIAKAPKFVRKFAVSNVEDFAEEQNYQRITVEVVKEQAESAGMGKFMKQAEGSKLAKVISLFKRDK